MLLCLFLSNTPTVLQYFGFQLLDQPWLKDSTRKPSVVSHLSQLQSILWRLYEYRQLGEPLDRSLVLEIFGPRVTAKKKDLLVMNILFYINITQLCLWKRTMVGFLQCSFFFEPLHVRSYMFYGSICSSDKWRNSCLSVWTMVCKFGLTLSKLHVLPVQDILLLTEWSWMTCVVNWVILLLTEFFLVLTCSALGGSNAWLDALEFKSVRFIQHLAQFLNVFPIIVLPIRTITFIVWVVFLLV